MQRRDLLGLGAGLSAALAGCASITGDDGTPSGSSTGTADADPAATNDAPGTTSTTAAGEALRGVYVQTFEETMSMQGTARSGRYEFASMFTVPHTFWNVNGSSVQETPRNDEDSIHLMANVWDTETRTVLPETGLSVQILQDGETVSEEVIYPMLSQPMGFHYGANFSLPGDGSYTTRFSVGGLSIRRTGAFEGLFGDPATVDVPLEFTDETRSAVSSSDIEQGGEPGALAPMEMGMMPQAIAPTVEELPGETLGRARSNDAVFVLTQQSPPAGVESDAGSYLVASVRTRYNRLLLPAMALEATVARDGETVFEGSLRRSLDPDLLYHYGAAAPTLESGDTVRLTVTTPPQVARHEGYEEAFLRMGPMELTV
jgi:hypothetical protein